MPGKNFSEESKKRKEEQNAADEKEHVKEPMKKQNMTSKKTPILNQTQEKILMRASWREKKDIPDFSFR